MGNKQTANPQKTTLQYGPLSQVKKQEEPGIKPPVSETNVDGLVSDRIKQDGIGESEISIKYKNRLPLVSKNASLFEKSKGAFPTSHSFHQRKSISSTRHTLLKLSQIKKSSLRRTLSEESEASHSDDDQNDNNAVLKSARLRDLQRKGTKPSKFKKSQTTNATFDDGAPTTVDRHLTSGQLQAYFKNFE